MSIHTVTYIPWISQSSFFRQIQKRVAKVGLLDIEGRGWVVAGSYTPIQIAELILFISW
jgi:hypothetical protein